MNFVVIGTDHRTQHLDHGLEGVLRPWLSRRYFQPLDAIAEEYHESIGQSIGQRLAQERDLRWYNVDMTTEEKRKAGIFEEQESRRTSQPNCRVPSDELREDAWVKKLTSSGTGTTIVICGYIHLESLVRKLRGQGHTVDQRVYLEVVPEIRVLGSSLG